MKPNTTLCSNKGLITTSIGIIVGIVLAAGKLLGGYFGNSYALIADGIESIADLFTSVLLWFALRWSLIPADANHPYGHGKIEALISLAIALFMTFASFLIIKNSLIHVFEPHEIPEKYTLLILIIVIVIKEIMYRYVLSVGKALKSDLIKADALHHRSDAITSVAALIGISISLIGGPGYETADDYAALFAALWILYNVYKIARPAIGELLDETLEPDLIIEIKNIASKVSGVTLIEQCKFRKMGTAYQVDMHIWVNKDLTVSEGHQIAHDVKNAVLKEIPRILDVHIHVEPYHTI